MSEPSRRFHLKAALRAGAACALAGGAFAAHAVDLRVLSGGAVEPGMRPALVAFERQSGHTVQISFAAAPELRAALRLPATADVIVAPQAVLDSAAAAESPPPAGGIASIGLVGVGVAVRAGAERPDVTSAETLKTELASADAVVYNRASTGLWIETVLQRLGMADAVQPKAVRVPDGAGVMRRLLTGTARREIGFAAMTEIVLFRDQGIQLVGPLPPPLQNLTRYVALPWPGAPAADAARTEAVAALMRHLQGNEARAIFVNAGIEPAP